MTFWKTTLACACGNVLTNTIFIGIGTILGIIITIAENSRKKKKS